MAEPNLQSPQQASSPIVRWPDGTPVAGMPLIFDVQFLGGPGYEINLATGPDGSYTPPSYSPCPNGFCEMWLHVSDDQTDEAALQSIGHTATCFLPLSPSANTQTLSGISLSAPVPAVLYVVNTVCTDLVGFSGAISNWPQGQDTQTTTEQVEQLAVGGSLD